MGVTAVVEPLYLEEQKGLHWLNFQMTLGLGAVVAIATTIFVLFPSPGTSRATYLPGWAIALVSCTIIYLLARSWRLRLTVTAAEFQVDDRGRRAVTVKLDSIEWLDVMPSGMVRSGNRPRWFYLESPLMPRSTTGFAGFAGWRAVELGFKDGKMMGIVSRNADALADAILAAADGMGHPIRKGEIPRDDVLPVTASPHG